MKISKINHREQDRIMLQFPFDQEKVNLVKQIEGATWSQTRKAWHIPYTIESFESMINLFPETDGSIAEFSKPKPKPVPKVEVPAIQPSIEKDVNIEVAGRKIFIRLPKNDDDTRFFLSLHYTKWDKKDRQWIIPHYPGNLEQIKDRFKLRINRLIVHETTNIDVQGIEHTVGRNEILIIRTLTGRLKLIFGIDLEIANLLKSFAFHKWDATNKWWSVPYTERYLAEITELALTKGMKVTYEEEPKGDKGISKTAPGAIPNIGIVRTK